jgi:hypothetical protein
MPLKDKELASSMHGSVETQAITVGNAVATYFVDPGSGYAYSTFDRDDYGDDSVSFAMTARGANVNLGTIAYAVLWAPPACENNNVPCFLSGSYDLDKTRTDDPKLPNTGLHEAKGFPGYAEALYPPPPADSGPSQERVYKCIVNKDGLGSPPGNGTAMDICKQSDGIPMSSWAETLADEYVAKGFSRAAGFDTGFLAVRGSESHSRVEAIGGGKLMSTGDSTISGISVLADYLKIENVHSEATIVSSDAGVDAKKSSARCTFSGITILGTKYADVDGSQLANPQIQKGLDQLATATNYKIELVSPSADPLAQVDEGKFVTGCAGFQIRFTDLHNGIPSPIPLCSPVNPPNAAIPRCIPVFGAREEISFGRISVQQSVNENATFADIAGTDEFDTGGGDLDSGLAADLGGSSDVGGGDLGGSGVGDIGSDAGSGAGTDIGSDTGSGGAGAGGAGGSGGNGSEVAYSPTGLDEGLDLQTIGALTVAGGAGLLFGVLGLIGVVNALAGGRAFKLPGFGG